MNCLSVMQALLFGDDVEYELIKLDIVLFGSLRWCVGGEMVCFFAIRYLALSHPPALQASEQVS